MPHDIRNYIDGRFETSGNTFDDINPVDGSLVGRVHVAGQDMVNRAVAAARAALSGPWGRSSGAERAASLHKVADGIEARFDEFVAAEIADTGKPLAQANTLDIPRAISNLRFFAGLAHGRSSELFATDTADGAGAINYTVQKPLGVVAVISPWNLPLLLLTWKLGPALAAGNTVVAKPSEETPGSATLLAEVMHEAGVPPGVFNLVHGFGAGSTGEFLCAHEDVDAITFTGESATGSAIMRAAAANVKALSFELGGKNPAIVFDDADFARALDGTVRSVFSNCGQVCLCSERVYVHESLFDQFVAALKSRAEALRIGWPADAQTEMGPLVSRGHRDKVLGYYALARAEGATVVTGGGVPEFGDRRDNGAWVQPTILTGLPESARCVREEIFGPVCHVAPFATEDQVIAMANDSAYGLAAAIWTEDMARAHRVAQQIEAGIVWVNCWYLRDLRTPFGGVKLSGVGREGGQYSMNFYSEPSNICIKL
ncbi:MAG: 2-hydroxymuconic semialdehyde dehydrogenase [Gammaproteobacteria bacterium]|nr:2-hydroxymuconic semialdehyde dehydrogenase [Gammaproteobacteria bacterium]MDH5305328.1 2-hydroxymuconic semialdehyde dehydrogenase [Gammaproteobacteria bacterium]MDH5322514.1 2-hydroxymuconic semialdehyde dehydrogenase [Gammaproteobacteria bacterium]